MIPCGATLASICPPCAERAKSLRAAQCREGWHLEDEPVPGPPAPDETQEYWLILRAEAQVQRDRAQAAGEDTSELDELLAELDTEITRAGIRGTVTTRSNDGTAEDAPVAVHPAPPGRPGPAPAQDRPADHRRGIHRPGRQVLPAVDVPHPDLRQLRQGPRRRHPRRSGHVRLPAGGAGRAALLRPGRPVHPEPAPRPRLRRAVLRRHRTAATAGPAPAPGHQGRGAQGRAAAGDRRHVPPGVVAFYRGRPLRWGRPAGLGREPRHVPRPGDRGSAAHLGSGPRRHRPAR